MISVPATADEFDLGGWRVQPAFNRALRGGAEVRLEPRVMQVLACLLQARGEPVVRDALIETVWGHPHISEDALNRTVSKLRRVLADDLGCAVTVETLPKVGYRLRGAAAQAPDAAPPAPVATPDSAPAAVATAAQPSQPSEPAPPGRSDARALSARATWIPLAIAVGLVAAIPLVVLLAQQRGPATSPGPAPAGPGSRIVPLTSMPGHEIQASLSPDASHVAFAARERRGTPWSLYLRSLEGEALHRVTDGPHSDLRPAWSPDGTQLAFVRLPPQRCEVHLVAPFGGSSRRVADCNADNAENLGWTADGRALAFAPPGARGLSLLVLADGSVRPLTTPPDSALWDGDPVFSPDGSRLAFTRWRAYGVADLHVVPLGRDGAPAEEPRRLTFDNLKLHGATWEPDAAHLVYSSNRGGGFALWRVGLEGGPPQRVPVSARAADNPVMSRDGRRLVYEEWTGQTNIHAIDGNAAAPVPEPVTRATRWDWTPQVSPDGARIAFVSDRSGSAELWVADRDGSDALRLTGFGGPYTGGGSWSPDGSRIVFDSPAVDGNFDLYVVDVQGGAPQRLTTDPAEERFPHWSADGAHIYYSARDGNDWQIWRRSAAPGPAPAEQVTRDGGYFAMPAADGALYFARNQQGGLWRLAQASPQDEPEPVLPELQPLDCGNWTVRDGVVWYVARGEQEQAFLARLDLASGERRRVVALPQLMYKSGLSADAAGRVYYAEIVRNETDLMLMERTPE